MKKTMESRELHVMAQGKCISLQLALRFFSESEGARPELGELLKTMN